MPKIAKILDLLQRFDFFACCVFFFSITIGEVSSTTSWVWLISWQIVRILTWAFEWKGFKETIINPALEKARRPYFFFILFWIIAAISLTYSEDLSFGLQNVNKFLITFLFFGLVGLGGFHKYYNFKTVAISYIAGVTFSCIIAIVIQYYSFHNDSVIHFSYLQNLSETFGNQINLYLHRIFFGFCMINAICLCLFFIPEIKQCHTKKKCLIIGAILIMATTFFIFIFLSGSRSCLLTLLMITLLGIDHYLYHSKSKIYFLICLTLGVFLVGLLFFSSPRLRSISPKELTKIENLKTIDPRFQAWKYSIDVIKESPIIYGNGVGDARNILLDHYQKVGDNFFYNKRLSSHNLYLNVLLGTGLIGLIIILIILSSPLWNMRKETLLPTLLILFNILMLSMVETMFSRHYKALIALTIFILLIELNNQKKEIKLPQYSEYPFFIGSLIPAILLFFFIVTTKTNKVTFDPKNPDTYCNSPFTRVDSLPGLIPSFIPAGTIGYQLDKTAKCEYNSDLNFCYTQSTLFNLSLNEDEYVNATVYCYVSKDFNGDEVKISTAGSNTNSISVYNLSQKGHWQKLSFKYDTSEFASSIYLSIVKQNAFNYNELTGYAIFAYPQIEIRKKNDLRRPQYDPFSRAIVYGENIKDCPYEYPTLNNIENEDYWAFDKNSGYNDLGNKQVAILHISDFPVPDSVTINHKIACYISPEFEGEVTLLLYHDINQPYFAEHFDINNRGWQIMPFDFNLSNKSIIYEALMVSCPNFEEQKGYVLFTNHKIEVKQKDN